MIHLDTAKIYNYDDAPQYFLVIVDDYSRFIVCLPLISLRNTFNQFTNWVRRTQLRYGYKLKNIRSDNGTEFKNSHFDQYCKSNGINQQFIIPYNPPSNGVVERAVRTIKNGIRKFSNIYQIDQSYWIFIAKFLIHIHNRKPSSSISFDLPYTRFTSRIPLVNHLREFATEAYGFIPKSQRTTMEPTTIKGRFIGYPEGQKEYLILLEDGRVLSFRQVIFIEKKKDEVKLATLLKINKYTSNQRLFEHSHQQENGSEDYTPVRCVSNSTIDDKYYNTVGDPRNRSRVVETQSPVLEERVIVDDVDKERESSDDVENQLSKLQRLRANRGINVRPVSNNNEEEFTGSDIYKVSSPSQAATAVVTKSSENQNTLPLPVVVSLNEEPQLDKDQHLIKYTFANVIDKDHLQSITTREKLMNFAIFDEVSPIIPKSYNDAMLQPDKSKWNASMRTQIVSHKKNNTWSLIPRSKVPKDANIIDLRWVYNRKFDRNGNKTIYKSRLVAKGFSQIQGIDYDETYSPVVK